MQQSAHAKSFQTEDLMPFGMPSTKVLEMTVDEVATLYLQKCGVDVRRSFKGIEKIEMYECQRTAMRFWRPIDVAGDELFYQDLSAAWPNYYQTERWEYDFARQSIGSGSKKVLEVGCGRGFFLQSLESLGHQALGLEFNEKAIKEKVTKFDIRKCAVEDVVETHRGTFDSVLSFQVLEHVIHPEKFIRSCTELLRPGGVLFLSTPNYDFPAHRWREDALDLPPHHINHFTKTVYENIARACEVEIVEIRPQYDEKVRGQRWIDADTPPFKRILWRMANALNKTIYQPEKVPGHSIAAVFRVT